jgi:hypothetical protein
MGAGQQQRYTDANAETMFSEPAANGQPDEQPGAMPEILPSEGFGKNIDRCWTCRSMFLQAWGTYGTAWPVIHQQLGVRPALNDDALAVVPQIPDGQPSVKGEDIRLGDGSASVIAARSGKQYSTRVSLERLRVRLTLGVTLPAGSRVASVYLDGRRVKKFDTAATDRGVEVTVKGGRSLTVNAH